MVILSLSLSLLRSALLELLLCRGGRTRRDLDEDVVALDDPARAPETDPPDHEGPVGAERERDVFPSLFGEEETVRRVGEVRGGDDQPDGEVNDREGETDAAREGLHRRPVAAIEFHRHLSDEPRVLERVGQLPQEHADEGRHVPGPEDPGAHHVRARHEVVRQKEVIVRGEREGGRRRVPPEVQDPDEGVVEHVPGAELQEGVRQLRPPRPVRLFPNFGDDVVLLNGKGDDQPRAEDDGVADRGAPGGGLRGRRRTGGPAEGVDQGEFAGEPDPDQKDGADQHEGNVKVVLREGKGDGREGPVHRQVGPRDRRNGIGGGGGDGGGGFLLGRAHVRCVALLFLLLLLLLFVVC